MTNQTLPPAVTPAPKPGAQGQYDAKTKGIITLGIIVLAAVGLIFPLFFMFYPEYQRDQLLKTGVPAQAEIVSIRPTGNTFNDQPQVSIIVRVMPENEEPYEAEVKMIINPVYLVQFQPGKTVQVRYDAEDRTKVAIEETEDGTR